MGLKDFDTHTHTKKKKSNRQRAYENSNPEGILG